VDVKFEAYIALEGTGHWASFTCCNDFLFGEFVPIVAAEVKIEYNF
jgi:hypothetical protein